MSTLFDSSVRVGSVLQFSYPTDNRIRVSTRLTRRRFVVESIRDLEFCPLDPLSYRLRPDLRRGRILVRGHDLDKHEWRQFYIDSARSIKTLDIPLRRLALYDPCGDGRPLKWIGPIWTDSRLDERELAAIIREFNRAVRNKKHITCVLGAFYVNGGRS